MSNRNGISDGRKNMKFTTVATAAAVFTMTAFSAQATELRLSHQWSTSDVRHQVAQIVADEVAAAGGRVARLRYHATALNSCESGYDPVAGVATLRGAAGNSEIS